METDFVKESWFEFLDHGQQDLVSQAEALYEREITLTAKTFHDYSFIVFPMAKAYEGFLKKFLFSLGLIGQGVYESETFRIGKSLNPDLPRRFRDHEWLVEKLDQSCGRVTNSPDSLLLSQVLWKQWKQSRNLLFHYFPGHENFLNLKEAGERIEGLREAMMAALNCLLKQK